MNFTSLTFLGICFPLLLILYYNPVLKGNGFRRLILLAASIGLYAVSDPKHVLLLLGMIFCNYLLVKLAELTNQQIFRAAAIAADVAVLLFFKYIGQLISFGIVSADYSVTFPIGLSYYTFKAISYAADSRKKGSGTILDAAIYIGNFLTIVSGPLSRYEEELEFITEKKTPSLERFYNGLQRMMAGLAKKVIIADSLAVLVRQCLAASDPSLFMAWAGAVGYVLQLYFDFSGYTDIAIGTGTVFGFDLPENFNFPYMSSSMTEFWKRWHMSLTKWFTKYIYIPMGGSRVSSGRHIFNLLTVWIVTGIWHGSKLTYIVWALGLFVLQVIEKYTDWPKLMNRFHLGHVYTMTMVCILWMVFRSESLTSAFQYVRSMFLLNGNAVIRNQDLILVSHYAVPLLLGIIFSTDISVKIRKKCSGQVVLAAAYDLVLLSVFVLCIIITISKGYTAPLYAGF